MRKSTTINEDEARSIMENHLSAKFNIDKSLLKYFSAIFNLKVYDKKKLIISENENVDKVAYIIKGLVRVYDTNIERDRTTWFLTENDFFMPAYYILTKENNYNNFEALEKTVVLESTYKQMEEVYEQFHKLEHFGRRLIESYFVRYMSSTDSILFQSAEDRYNTFVKNKPELLNRVSLKFIASYLGISQETLSRIRAKQL